MSAKLLILKEARVAEQVDARDLKSLGVISMPVQIRPRALIKSRTYEHWACKSFSLCAEHVRQLGGESPLPNLMEVKG